MISPLDGLDGLDIQSMGASKRHWTCPVQGRTDKFGTLALYTCNYSLKYCSDRSDELELLSYVDADYGSNLIDRRSTTGYVFVFCHGPISWQSQKQPTLALSTIEAEYMALL
jgi:hypothetical protein